MSAEQTVSTITLRSRVVFPIDRPPIENGAVVLDGETIAAVGEADIACGKIYDLGDVAILPGFVNAHTHLEFSELPHPLGTPGMCLVDWIRLVIGWRSRADANARRAIQAGLRECVASAATTVGEIATTTPAVYSAESMPELRLLTEVIGFSRARAASAFSAARSRIDETETLRQSGDRSAPRIRHGVSPHAPYTVSPALLDDLIEMARQRNLPVAMHLAESTEELQFLESATGRFQELLDERSMWDRSAIPRGSRPLDYLHRLAAAPRALVIHGNYLDHQERAFLAEHAARMTLVYCPRTHAYFGHSPYPLTQLIALGVRVALGTDSRASNPDLDLMHEMRQVARMHPTIEPHTILRMATLDGAEALGYADRVGSITPGKLANFVAFPLSSTDRSDANDPLAALLDCADKPLAIWLRGRRL